MAQHALIGAQVFDGRTLQSGQAVVLTDSVPQAIARHKVPTGCATTRLQGGVLLPGFVDLQVNGGGGVMLGDAPTPESS